MPRQTFVIPCVLALLAGSSAAALAEEAGRIVFVTGQARVARQPAVLDGAVQEGDALSTGADGYVYIKTSDGGFFILRPNTKARIAAYHIDEKNPANTRVKLELTDGVARSISGNAVKQARQNFRFNTPVAAIGVRGTDFIVYTDQQTSRVAVVSGGVVVSGFGGPCGREGSGPCEGEASRELFAGKAGMLLQIRRGQSAPQLLNNPALMPDQNVQPRPDEPVGKVAHAGLSALDVNLDAQKGVDPRIKGKPTVNQAPAVPALPLPPLPTPVEKGPPEVLWGRWAAVAGMAPERAAIDKMNGAGFDKPTVVGAYALSRVSNTSLVLPREGSASFVPAESEVTLQKAGAPAQIARLENARLDVDFAARSFSTSMSVVGEAGKVNVNVKGDITKTGRLESSPLSATVVRGYLGGAKADEAAYVFKAPGFPDLTAAGAVRWTR
ncbi:MAG: FecR domain-containing protein [Burkholderiaceae bacterium]|nr:FecR domain-containing protein [Burkholderiaceae bacterium]